jgi:futalosine hydrolase
MYLIVAATEDEIKPFVQFADKMKQLEFLVTGVGPLASAIKLTRYLSANSSQLSGVLNIGVGGAYPDSDLDVLDICIAGQEVLGDLGICMEDEIIDFDLAKFFVTKKISMESPLLSRVEKILKTNSLSYSIVNFVTVNCCSGTEERGAFLQSKYQAACENMEGAAVAFACQEFQVPCVEIRCISNNVEDRNVDNWQLADACDKVCTIAHVVLESLISRQS